MPRDADYSLVDAAAARERRKSSPDSDPRELKAKILDHRFALVMGEVAGLKDADETLDARTTKIESSLSDVQVKLAEQGASIKAWIASATLFLALFTAALRLLK